MRFSEFLIEKYFDLNAMYDKFNVELFNNELPKIKVRWNNSKRTAGKVSYHVRNKPDGTKEFFQFKYIAISHVIENSEDEIADTLVHEMIHAALIDRGILDTSGPDKDHGPEFQELKKEIEKKYGRPIPDTEDIFDKPVASHVKDKSIGVVILRKADTGNYFASFTSEAELDYEWSKIVRVFTKPFKNGKYDFFGIGAIDSKLHAKYRMRKRVFDRDGMFTSQRISDVEAKEIIKKLKDLKFKKILER